MAEITGKKEVKEAVFQAALIAVVTQVITLVVEDIKVWRNKYKMKIERTDEPKQDAKV